MVYKRAHQTEGPPKINKTRAEKYRLEFRLKNKNIILTILVSLTKLAQRKDCILYQISINCQIES